MALFSSTSNAMYANALYLTTCSDEIPAWSTQDEAEEMLNKALAINPNHDKAKNNLEVVKYERAHPKTH